MLSSSAFLVLLLAAYTSAASMGARTIQRSSRTTDVNLVEFAFENTIHGKCQYNDRSGRVISLIYEEQNDTINARSLNIFVDDPVASVKECRAAATEVPKIENLEGRSNKQETIEELKKRLNWYAKTTTENEDYVSYLEPRFMDFIGKLFQNSGSSNNDNFGFSFGNKNNQGGLFPGIAVYAPYRNPHLTATGGTKTPFSFFSPFGWGAPFYGHKSNNF